MKFRKFHQLNHVKSPFSPYFSDLLNFETLSIFETIILNLFYQIGFLENADLAWTKRALCKSNVPFNLKMHKQAPWISDKRSSD